MVIIGSSLIQKFPTHRVNIYMQRASASSTYTDVEVLESRGISIYAGPQATGFHAPFPSGSSHS